MALTTSNGPMGKVARLLVSTIGFQSSNSDTQAEALAVVQLDPNTGVPSGGVPGIAVQTNVVGTVASTTLLVTNIGRKGAVVFNDSTAVLYLLLGSGVASPTSHTTQVVAGGYYQIPFGFTGAATGTWAAAAGAARVTELT